MTIERSKEVRAVGEQCETHPFGCYIAVDATDEEGTLAVIDFDENGDVVGIEFPYGVESLPFRKGGKRSRCETPEKRGLV